MTKNEIMQSERLSQEFYSQIGTDATSEWLKLVIQKRKNQQDPKAFAIMVREIGEEYELRCYLSDRTDKITKIGEILDNARNFIKIMISTIK